MELRCTLFEEGHDGMRSVIAIHEYDFADEQTGLQHFTELADAERAIAFTVEKADPPRAWAFNRGPQGWVESDA